MTHKLRLEDRLWWNWINVDIKNLLIQSVSLVQMFEQHQSKDIPRREKFQDYSFVVFPAAKAYEGFLKTLFRDLGFISDADFYGKRFRIGKALNPSLESHLRDSEGVYDKLVSFCGGNELPDRLWETWKEGRNSIFHWFPNESNVISLDRAKDIIEKIISAIDLAFKGCNIRLGKTKSG